MSRRLHIGGEVRAEGWEVMNALPGPAVDHIGNAKDLSCFESEIFQELYASHVLEHLDYQGELQSALNEWYRVLVPGGKLYVSVPDMDALSRLFLAKAKLPMQERFYVMQMMFGGHENEYDFHGVGLNQEFLEYFLKEAGFVELARVDNFWLFRDTSTMVYQGIPISVNMTAIKAGNATDS